MVDNKNNKKNVDINELLERIEKLEKENKEKEEKINKLMEKVNFLENMNFRGYGWFKDALEEIKKHKVISFVQLRGKFRSLSNTNIKLHFFEYIKDKVVVLEFFGRGRPLFLIYLEPHEEKMFWRFESLWRKVFLKFGGLPTYEMSKLLTIEEINYIKKFLHEHFKDYLIIDGNGIYKRKK